MKKKIKVPSIYREIEKDVTVKDPFWPFQGSSFKVECSNNKTLFFAQSLSKSFQKQHQLFADLGNY